MVSKQLVRVLVRQANSLHASASHRRADAKGRIEEQSQACSIGRRSITAAVQSNDEGTRKAAFVGKQCSCECRPDRQTVRIRLALQSSRKLARVVKDSSRLRCKAKREATNFASKQILLMLLIQSCKQFACTTQRRAARGLLDWSEISHSCGAKQRGRTAVGQQATLASASLIGRQFVCTTYQSATSFLDWSKIRHHSCGARQRGRRQPLSASSSCECQQERHTILRTEKQTPKAAPQSCHKLVRLVGDPSRLRCKAKRKEGSLCRRQAALVSAGQPDRQTVLRAPRTTEEAQACSIGRRSVTAALQSKEEGGQPLSFVSAPASAC